LDVADGAARFDERAFSCDDLCVGNAAIGRRLRWRRKEAYEIGKVAHVLDQLLRLGELVLDAVLRCWHDLATRGWILDPSLSALIGEQLVANALFDVVGLSREDHERLVLRLPTKTGDGPIVPVAIRMSEDAEALRAWGQFVPGDRGVLDRFDQAS